MKQEDVTAHCSFFPIKWLIKTTEFINSMKGPRTTEKKATLLKDISKTERCDSSEMTCYINEDHVLFKHKLEMLFQVWSVINYAL